MRIYQAWVLTVLLAGFLSACAGTRNASSTMPSGSDPDLLIDQNKNPDARYLEGNIYSLRPLTAEMFIGSGKNLDDLGSFRVKYTQQTRFFIDGQPATLDQIRPAMPVKIRGHMEYPNGRSQDGQMIADVVKFSSNTPPPPPAPPAGANHT